MTIGRNLAFEIGDLIAEELLDPTQHRDGLRD